jgi:hypothetical protein
MNLILHLPPETAAKLNEHAHRIGKEPAALALEALQDKLAAEDDARLPRDKWHARFEAFLASVPRTGATFVDDSRESIYPDRW